MHIAYSFDNLLGLVCFAVSLNDGKHGGLQQIVARLMLATLAVSILHTGSQQSIHQRKLDPASLNNLCLLT